MRTVFFLFTFLISLDLAAQPAAEALANDTKTLQERYGVMKSKSQTYNDYKVIKEVVLDGMWRLVMDSVSAGKLSLQEAKANIRSLQDEVGQLKLSIEEKNVSMEEIVHDSTHIDVLGIPFHKAVFVSGVAVVLAGLIGALLVMVGRMKIQNKSLSEKNLALNALTHEFDDYRHRAMEKQTKLSRELQDERNKLQGLRNA